MSSSSSARVACAAPGGTSKVRESKPKASVRLHVGIVRASSAFRNHPVYVLGRVLDVTGLAVNAILRVDLKSRRTFFHSNDFVNARRTITLLRRVVEAKIDVDRDRRILERKVD